MSVLNATLEMPHLASVQPASGKKCAQCAKTAADVPTTSPVHNMFTIFTLDTFEECVQELADSWDDHKGSCFHYEKDFRLDLPDPMDWHRDELDLDHLAKFLTTKITRSMKRHWM